MNVVTYTDARANLKAVMDKVVDDCAPTLVTRQRGEPIVMITLAEWNSWQETEYLLSSPRNAERLREGIRQLDAGQGVERELIDL